MLRREAGITLLELMIVVAVVGILATIAYPSYRDQVRRSNRTEAKVALEQTAAALEKCFTRYMTYADFANCPAADQFQAGGGFDTPHGHYRIAGTITTTDPLKFTLTATPQNAQEADTQCGTFGLNQSGIRTESGTGTVATCW